MNDHYVGVTRYRCREEGELVRIPCRPECGCPSQQYPKPLNNEAGRAGKSAAGGTETHARGGLSA